MVRNEETRHIPTRRTLIQSDNSPLISPLIRMEMSKINESHRKGLFRRLIMSATGTNPNVSGRAKRYRLAEEFYVVGKKRG